jgi:hypothetical protein
MTLKQKSKTGIKRTITRKLTDITQKYRGGHFLIL